MIKIAVNGICGRMGSEIVAAVEKETEFTVVGGIDPLPGQGGPGLCITANPVDVVPRADVVIDFSLPEGALHALDFCLQYRKPLVTGTTGFSAAQMAEFQKAGETIPIVQAFNFSIGINLLAELVSRVASSLGEGADVEIVETHHRMKKDAPSGTALLLAEKTAAATGKSLPGDLQHGRQGIDLQRGGEIGIHSLRGGAVVGEHEVRFFCASENLVLSHQALSRRIFADGALRAARWVVEQKQGLYGMKEVLGF